MSDFVNRLKAAMDKAGVKAVDLHNRTGISKSTISEYLSGNYEPKQKNIYKLATALGILPSELMGITPAPPPNAIPMDSYTYKIPLLGRVAAGEPIYADEHIESYEFIDSRYKDDGNDYEPRNKKRATPKDGYKRKKSLPHLDFQIAEALKKEFILDDSPLPLAGYL